MKIYTGYFAKIRQYREAGLETISIARFNRYYQGASLKLLAPAAEIIHYPEDVYLPIYKDQLKKLSPEGILENIKSLAHGKDCILLCYEKPGEFCHRRIVAKWLNHYLNIDVQEYPTEKRATIIPTLF
jgi:hypothetical protein